MKYDPKKDRLQRGKLLRAAFDEIMRSNEMDIITKIERDLGSLSDPVLPKFSFYVEYYSPDSACFKPLAKKSPLLIRIIKWLIMQ